MSNLVQFLKNYSSTGNRQQKKEKIAELLNRFMPARETQEFGVKTERNLNTPKALVPKDIIDTSKTPSPIPQNDMVSGRDAVSDQSNQPRVEPSKGKGFSGFSKLAYRRNTGISRDGEDYVNSEDTELLAKLGYAIDIDEYSILEKTSERMDIYSYIEKCAGVPKDVSRCVDEGKAFSAEFLKDMDYSVPKGYEIKGDLVCPVEKTASEEKESSEKTAVTDHPLKSSNIKAVGYSKKEKTLDVAFHSGGEYTYKDVPKSLFDRIKKVKSPGRFFHKHIKKKEYPYAKQEKE